MAILNWPGRDALPPVQKWTASEPRGTADASDVPDPADAHESTALYWVPVRELFGLMTAGLISAQPSMLALLYAERAGLLRELPH
jgi:hypothetical protein